MRVGIHEAGKDDPAAQVEFFGAARLRMLFNLPARAYGGDSVIADENSSVANNADIPEGFAATRYRPLQREEFRAAGNEPVGHERSARC